MEDINAAIGSILSDPQKMEQLRQVAQSLGLNPPPSDGAPQPDAPQQNGGGFDPSAIASILQNFQNAGQNNTNQESNSSNASGGANNLDAIGKIAGIMSTFNQSDKNVELLRSLKPHFSTTRAGKIDDAIRIMQVMRAWPALRDSGLLGGLGNLFSGGGSK